MYKQVKGDLGSARKLNAQYRDNISSMQDDIDSTKAILNMTKEDVSTERKTSHLSTHRFVFFILGDPKKRAFLP